MLHTVTVRTLALAACGWLLAWDASALTLGRARGAALIGRPLELAVPVTLDPGPETEAPCASADLFYGETPVGRAPSVRWEPRGPSEGVLHVSSGDPVDEPMVTVYLRVGCGQSTTRRFVLLSELPPQNESSTAPTLRATPAAPAIAHTSPRRRDAVAQLAPGLRAETALPAPETRPVRPAPAQRAKKQETAATGPRLKLEPLDLSIDRDPTLRLATELHTQVASDPQQRAAAAALWAVLQKSPDEAMQDRLRLQGVQRELESLRDATRQNTAAVGEMRAQVEQARGYRNLASLLVLLLSAVLLALLGWLGWRWHRVRQLERVGEWFDQHGEAVHAPAEIDLPIPVPPPAPPPPPAPMPAAAPVSLAVRTRPSTAAGPVSAWGAGTEFNTSRGGAARMVGVEELIDVHDKADFFLSIGEYDQAVSVLESHVHDQVETSALAWMDLLELYHSLGKRVEYERLRGEFRQRFTAQVPDFDHFDQPSASLENYSRALSRIVALWPSTRVLEVIEESMFRQPGMPGADPFSLEAYRELVLLYHIARDITPVDPVEPKPVRATNFPETALQPLHSLDARESTLLGLGLGDHDPLLVPPASSRLGVDIDLDEPDPGAQASAPEAVGARSEEEPTRALPELDLMLDGPAPHGARADLPPLDFDISACDPPEEAPKRKRSS